MSRASLKIENASRGIDEGTVAETDRDARGACRDLGCADLNGR